MSALLHNTYTHKICSYVGKYALTPLLRLTNVTSGVIVNVHRHQPTATVIGTCHIYCQNAINIASAKREKYYDRALNGSHLKSHFKCNTF